MIPQVYHLRVFADGPNGGNPLPVVVDATGMTDLDMQAVATSSGHESGFVFPAPSNSACDFEFRFWVPQHEMEMCGHATIGAMWLLEKMGRLCSNQLRVFTKSGIVEANVEKQGEITWVEISQGQGTVDVLAPDADVVKALLSTLGIGKGDLASNLPIQNSSTSRVKTMIPMVSVSLLDALSPQFDRIEQLCERLGSTGLYPYAIDITGSHPVFRARQFPKKSGYPEDAATGIAAAALAFALLENRLVGIDDEITINQGQVMGSPSSIAVRFRTQGDINPSVIGCWISGTAVQDEEFTL